MGKMFRQGDVLIEEVSELPSGPERLVPREGGRVILAHGEVTGHAHAITDQSAVLMSFDVVQNGTRRGTAVAVEERYLKLERQSTLKHEEHGPIELPAGTYKVTIQRQWDPVGWRQVVD